MKEATIKVTEKEKQVLQNIVNSEFMAVSGEDMVGVPIWSWSATNRSRSLAGALGSLTKKNLVVSKVEKEGRTVFLTKAGFDIAMADAVSDAVSKIDAEAAAKVEAEEVEIAEIEAIEADVEVVS